MTSTCQLTAPPEAEVGLHRRRELRHVDIVGVVWALPQSSHHASGADGYDGGGADDARLRCRLVRR